MTIVGDLMQASSDAQSMSLDRFTATYDIPTLVAAHRSHEQDPDSGWTSALHGALRNPGSSARFDLANLLLDHGWPVGRVALLIQFEAYNPFGGRRGHADPRRDAELAARLLAAGADANYLERRGSRPLLLLMNSRFSDAELQPIYDVLLASGRLEPGRQDTSGDSVLRRLWRDTTRVNRNSLAQQLLAYMREHDQPIPALGSDHRRNLPL
ncbi:hypothetical protein [Parenemella sanctibonifatiensis]|uniref:Ankyrin repeat domain-containing protein n=1 Tax=Parenemella sanctibonifatiensis TaxID=2016505 RepID=A0A255E8E6_9ACTN|nr:hypothetical protein [Parenemella sanctibonifatiensis]OYN87829.1 hypothetical protein CGZ92_06065 [Parenemella sanctibonifatiensis]OYN92134.1 hypothetical protein CGZ91_01045 [Parenemella sanctibonifatiensis]